MAIFLSNDDVRRLLTVAECVDVLEDMFRQEANGLVELLHRRRFGFRNGVSATLMGGSVVGSKAYAVRNSNVSLLFDTDTLRVEAVFEPNAIALTRTGAASGLATKYMARLDSTVVGVIGTGRQALAQLEAVKAVRPYTLVKVYSRNAEKRQAFAREAAAALDVEVLPVESAEQCVRGSRIVVTVTNSHSPVFDGAWLEAGTHVNAAGSNSWLRRELDETTIRRAARVVVDNLEQARTECGELMYAAERGSFDWRDAVELHEVVSGKVPGRPSPDAITLFESQGIGTEDTAAYAYVLRKAKEQGIGQPLPF